MKKTFAAAAALVAVLGFAAPSHAESGVKIGLLSCAVDGGPGFIIGSSKTINCAFKGSHGVEHYAGKIGKLGVDIGITRDTVIAWAVFAPGKLRAGSLAGSYNGVTAEATALVGVGANVLIGGFEKTINLQPVSIQGQTGLNVAAGLASLQLEYVGG